MKEIYSRQNFLGHEFQAKLSELKVGIIGLGGGGSQVTQALSHLGITKFYICDPDHIESHNINRLIGSHKCDIKKKLSKVDIASRLINQICNNAEIQANTCTWQEMHKDPNFKNLDVIFSCLDTFESRRSLEEYCRELSIPLIDIGVTVYHESKNNFQMSGQVILSHPNGPCFRCFGFCTDDDIENQNIGYGHGGIRPQVIWSNGILANCAVGLMVDMFSNWTKNNDNKYFYKCYDGNKQSLIDHPIIKNNLVHNIICSHYT